MGIDVDLAAVVDPDGSSDAGVPNGAVLLRFASAAQGETADLPAAREALRSIMGDDALVEASATVAIFNGLVRVADGTGIQLDAGLEAASATTRHDLGIDSFAGSANTPAVSAGHADRSTGVTELFG